MEAVIVVKDIDFIDPIQLEPSHKAANVCVQTFNLELFFFSPQIAIATAYGNLNLSNIRI